VRSLKASFSRMAGLVLCSAVLWAGSAGTSFGAETTSFTPIKFKAAQEAGKTILVDVHADWCSTCQKQAPAIKKLSKERPFSGAVFMRVDYDNDKRALRTFNVQYQSTLIVFKGKKEMARSTGETDPQRIRALLERGL